jgi:hypothetical protein
LTLRTIAFFVCIILCWISSASHAANISCDLILKKTQQCISGRLEGQISQVDYEKIETFLRAHFPNVDDFYLISPGGDVDEALKIGRLFRKQLIGTSSVEGCASSCALIWLGGIHRTGRVGLHRPYRTDPMFKALSPADASIAYRQLLERITTYLDEMEVPKSIIETMVATSSDDIHWVYAGTDKLGRPPSIAEWEDATCGPDREGLGYNHFLERSECIEHLRDSHMEPNIGFYSKWLYLLLGAAIVFSIWLIILRLKVLPPR